jgi:hypothetical protein
MVAELSLLTAMGGTGRSAMDVLQREAENSARHGNVGEASALAKMNPHLLSRMGPHRDRAAGDGVSLSDVPECSEPIRRAPLAARSDVEARSPVGCRDAMPAGRFARARAISLDRSG